MNTRIKQIRRELDLTQAKFAERIGMKQNSIALIESGKRNISDQAILSICREYGINEEWLRTGHGNKTGIGTRLRRLRRELDLTQEAFASRIGSVQNTITGYESGRRNPSAPVVSLICREFNVSEEWLRNGDGEMFLPEPKSELEALAKRYDLSAVDEFFVERFVKLKPEEREVITNFFTNLSG